MTKHVDWTPAMEQRLTRLFMQGYSAGRTACAMGITRNMVIGKWQRLGLTEDKRPILDSRIKRKNVRSLKPLSLMEQAAKTSIAVDACRWTIGNPNSTKFRFCGETAANKSVYCTKHQRQAAAVFQSS